MFMESGTSAYKFRSTAVTGSDSRTFGEMHVILILWMSCAVNPVHKIRFGVLRGEYYVSLALVTCDFREGLVTLHR